MKESRIIRNALTYAHNFRGQIIVIKLDNDICKNILKNQLATDIISIAKTTDMTVYIVATTTMQEVIEEMEKLSGFPKIDQKTNYCIIPILVDGKDDLADKKACEIAITYSAKKLIFITTSDGIYDRDKTLIHQMDLAEAKTTINNPRINGSIKNKLVYSTDACEKGVERIHFISGHRNREDSLLRELFSTEGVGTMISANIYQNCRMANIEDVEDIIRIFSASNFHYDIGVKNVIDNINQFHVYTIDDDIHGVIQLVPSSNNKTVQIQRLAVQEVFDDFSTMIKMLETIITKTRLTGKESLVLDIQQCPSWIIMDQAFYDLGFKKIADPKIWSIDL